MAFRFVKHLQMILKTLCAFLALLLEIFGVYGDGEFKWYSGYGLYTKNLFFRYYLSNMVVAVLSNLSPLFTLAA